MSEKDEESKKRQSMFEAKLREMESMRASLNLSGNTAEWLWDFTWAKIGVQRYANLTVRFVSRYRPYDTYHNTWKTINEKTNEQCHLF
jgi:hypothetical protein